MSYQGQSPKVNRLRLNPRSSDPVNPLDGDLQYADGTIRAEGLYVYRNNDWFPVVDTDRQINKIRFAPQSSDPSSPAIGDVFYSDGTSRAKGLWVYTSQGWSALGRISSVEFKFTRLSSARLAGTGLLSSLYNGQSFGGGTLVTGDTILVLNIANTYENGLYIVQTSGAPVRLTSANTAAKLSRAHVEITEGTNARNQYYQRNILTNLTSDVQNWQTTPGSFSFVVPDGVTDLQVYFCGGGGGGSSGGNSVSSYLNIAGNITQGSYPGAGGAGGNGSCPFFATKSVTSGETLTVTIGAGGLGGANGNVNPIAGTNGSSSTITNGVWTLTATGGLGSNTTSSVTPTSVLTAGGNAYSTAQTNFGSAGISGQNGGDSIFGPGGSAGVGGAKPISGSVISSGGNGGGGGGSSIELGGNGGNGGTGTAQSNPGYKGSPGGIGAGGGGGGGGSTYWPSGNGNSGATGAIGSGGGPGYVRLSW